MSVDYLVDLAFDVAGLALFIFLGMMARSKLSVYRFRRHGMTDSICNASGQLILIWIGLHVANLIASRFGFGLTGYSKHMIDLIMIMVVTVAAIVIYLTRDKADPERIVKEFVAPILAALGMEGALQSTFAKLGFVELLGLIRRLRYAFASEGIWNTLASYDIFFWA